MLRSGAKKLDKKKAVSFVYEVCVEFTVAKHENITFGDKDIMALIGKVEEFQENDNWIK